MINIRPATMHDADAILTLVNHNAKQGLMLPKSPYAVYLAIPNMFVADENGQVIACCRLAVVWNDMAEVASLAVAESHRRHGIGRDLVNKCLSRARDLKIKRLFTLTYQTPFFQKCGFTLVDRASLPYKVFGDCLNCPKVNNCDENALILDI